MNRETIRKLVESLQKGLRNSPPAHDIVASEEFTRKLRAGYATLTTAVGQMESARALHLRGTVEYTSEDTYKRIKNSSTIQMMFSDANDPELCEMYHTVKEVIRLIQQTSDEYRTFISFRKEELKAMKE